MHKQTVAHCVTGTALLHASWMCTVSHKKPFFHGSVTMQAVSKVAVSSRIMHPNIVSCQGVSEHPASKDLLLVSCVQCRMYGLAYIDLTATDQHT